LKFTSVQLSALRAMTGNFELANNGAGDKEKIYFESELAAKL
jgi:hypothetical protein